MALPIFDFLLGQKNKNTAAKAKDRLQIILAHERSDRKTPDYLPKMREEILQVIGKYVDVDPEQLNLSIDEDNGFEVLELNLVLPENSRSK